jgi:hypothetical protein
MPVTEGFDQGANPTYYQHAAYRIFDTAGKEVKYVGNSTGHYSSSPRLVSLAPGNYIVEARARDYLMVKVPVVIESAQTTTVHLDDRWQPPAGTPKTQVVMEPDGYAVGWRAGPWEGHPSPEPPQNTAEPRSGG